MVFRRFFRSKRKNQRKVSVDRDSVDSGKLSRVASVSSLSRCCSTSSLSDEQDGSSSDYAEYHRRTYAAMEITRSQSQNYMKSYFQFEELTAWRKRVYNNPMEFVNLCLLLDCHPDLNNVKIWSNWLTPGNQYLSTRYDSKFFLPTRYDSKFFLVMFNDTDLPKCDIDYCEMKSLQWCTPEQLIKDSMEGKLWLPPPQFYECSRLLNFRTLAELDSFLSSRNSKQCEQWLPVRVKAKDGEIGLLPGDWMYPPNGVNITSTDYYKDHSDLTMSELQHYGHQHEDTSKLPIHRMQYRGPFAFELVVQNIQSSSSHSVAFSRGRHMYNLPSSEHTSKL
ncbi:nucleoside diphosphate-linked moiety X motif 19-like [Diaphorina citri]|uniref:Nucleoside diphosphate-linked moiety X motif 19-like n=1 Tax=Diaphorina citri TaxID=121845 RepID=A0A3Q0IUI8_DIACI|nr:nucleoside diphosphate-linked moiety X motif 19-like [Diaphorina citri]